MWGQETYLKLHQEPGESLYYSWELRGQPGALKGCVGRMERRSDAWGRLAMQESGQEHHCKQLPKQHKSPEQLPSITGCALPQNKNYIFKK